MIVSGFKTTMRWLMMAAAVPSLLMAQQPASTTAQGAATTQPQPHPYGPGNLAERPHGLFMPEPSYPTTPRHDAQFTVEYVYRYAESSYTPAVPLPSIPKEKEQLDTPEHAFQSLISAARSLDYDWWLSLWDARAQAIFRENATAKKQDAAFWRDSWKSSVQGKTVFLQKRLELVNYVILEYSTDTGNTPSKALQPIVFKLVDGKWRVTQELADSTVLFLIGQGPTKISGAADFAPIAAYSGQKAPLEAEQQLFFEQQPKGLTSASKIVW